MIHYKAMNSYSSYGRYGRLALACRHCAVQCCSASETGAKERCGRLKSATTLTGLMASMLLVTGGAGFIGSNVVASLNEAGRADIAVNDVLGSDGKWRNLAGRQLAEFVPPADLLRWLDGRKLDAVVHLGAISLTTATDADLVIETNFRLSLRLFEWCAATRTPFIYASSAATYGDGAAGFSDDWSGAALKRLKPMNLYGWSKHLFDLALVER